jgi:hypothetical protein
MAIVINRASQPRPGLAPPSRPAQGDPGSDPTTALVASLKTAVAATDRFGQTVDASVAKLQNLASAVEQIIAQQKRLGQAQSQAM